MNTYNKNSKKNIQKSLKQRFLLVIGILFLLVYLILGIMVMFWKKLPLDISDNARLAFGILLIVYAVFRFYRLIKSNSDESK